MYSKLNDLSSDKVTCDWICVAIGIQFTVYMDAINGIYKICLSIRVIWRGCVGGGGLVGGVVMGIWQGGVWRWKCGWGDVHSNVWCLNMSQGYMKKVPYVDRRHFKFLTLQVLNMDFSNSQRILSLPPPPIPICLPYKNICLLQLSNPSVLTLKN